MHCDYEQSPAGDFEVFAVQDGRTITYVSSEWQARLVCWCLRRWRSR